ncbi:hypothetical protein EZV62_019405 [Acer yangbiense]|uniref:G domain-containing protein n=1 Tax=Acer yangbiense TaxID=1000413 RepID=A0A5C7HBD4_9ROSI|nr:hypothetical protein EZV62_019405 [Acer yangbiense]
MGGDSTIPLHGCSTDDIPLSSSAQTPAFLWDDLSSSEFDQRRMRSVYRQVLQSYHQFQTRIGTLGEAKTRILSYTPASWIENVGGMKLGDYDVPKTTSLVLVGPKCSGKSSLINRISKVFEDDKFASERAQVTCKVFILQYCNTDNSSVGDGTYFLQEYKIPRGSNSFCLYDTRSLSDVPSIDIDMIKHWITKGVRHGEPVIRESDSSSLRDRIKCKARENGCQLSENRMVNFFIFVVDGLSVLKSIESDGDVEKQYTQMIATTFNCPYLSFKDDKPVVVVTHGDLLSLTDRARVRTHLGELLGVPPMQQIFDISESDGLENELIIVDMLRYCLEHADKNLPHKNGTRNKVFRMSVSAFVYLLVLGIAILSVYRHMHVLRASDSEHDVAVDWHSIRHLWYDD